MSPLEQLNVHHLRALDAILAERSVTRAAVRLGITQSAVSHALRGLRDALEDPLLVRGAGGMVPTPRALALQQPLHRALNDLEAALSDGPTFDPATSTRTFRLLMPDSFTLSVLPGLLDLLASEAPGVDLDVRPPPLGGSGLEGGDADLSFVVGKRAFSPSLRKRTLFDGRLACIVRRDHPEVSDELDLDTYCALPHALMSPLGSGPGIIDGELAKIGRSRRVHLRIRFFLAAPLLIARSNMVLTGPRDLLEAFVPLAPVRLLEPPVHAEAFQASMLWHERNHEDPGHRWLRQSVVRAMQPSG